MHDTTNAIYDNPSQIIKDSCPEYPAPYYCGYTPGQRILQLNTFEIDAVTVTAALTRQALKAIAHYLKWLECNTEAADNEKHTAAALNNFKYEPVEEITNIKALRRIKPIIEELIADDDIKRTAYNRQPYNSAAVKTPQSN